MAQKKKTTKKKSGGGLFGFLKRKKPAGRKRKTASPDRHGLKISLSVMAATILLAGVAVGLFYLKHYTMSVTERTLPMGTVIFKERPPWLNQQWRDWIIEDILGGDVFLLDEDASATIGRKLEATAWLKNVRVKTTPVEIEVYADHRRPIGLVKSGGRQYYVADDMTVMNPIPMPSLNIVELRGISSQLPDVGQTWLAEDAKAAIKILDMLYRTDLHFQLKRENDPDSAAEDLPTKPLLSEISSIDVSNYAARKNRSAPNIVLIVNDGTKIHWGAAWGQATVYIEQDEKDKLARLYQHFMDHNNQLAGTAKFIELRWPEGRIPRPH